MDAAKLMRGDSTMATQPATLVWPGWIGNMPANDVKNRFTWEEWSARLRQQREHPQSGPERTVSLSPRRSEVAARAFLAWFDDAASDRHAPPFDDRELAVRRFMRNFQEVAAMLDQFSGPELARLRLLRKRRQAG
jgi:hypothetical protein